MKLKEVAELRLGVDLPRKNLVSIKKADTSYFQVISPNDFQTGTSFYITQKEFRKIGFSSNSAFIFYGDYLLFKKDSKYVMFRYDDISGQTLPTMEIIVISPVLNILTDFLSSSKNKKYFLTEINRIFEREDSLNIDDVLEIDIMTDDIMELENSNRAEQIGIRQPINKEDLPFRITQKPLPIDKLLKRVKYSELLLDAEFQRRPGLWDLSTKSRLIESMIIRLPIPAFYFDGTDDNRWLVIDGLQRLSAVNDFVDGKFALTNLDYLPELEELHFQDLERSYQRNIEEYEIFAYILEDGTPKSVIYKIFKSINTSALKLELQEIRHAINPGVPAVLLKEISEKTWFRKELLLTDRQVDRMEDREVALRYLAFQVSNYLDYKPTIGDFLDQSMTDLYDIPRVRQVGLINDLKNILEIVREIFGSQAFSRNLFDDSRVFGHNNIIFELLTYSISILSNDKRKLLVDRKDKFNQSVKNYFLSKPSRFWESDSAYSQDGLISRFQEFESLTRKVLK